MSFGIRFSLHPLSYTDSILSIPLYAIEAMPGLRAPCAILPLTGDMATFGEFFKSGIDLSVDELPAELLRDFDLQQYIVPTRLRDATEDVGLEAKIILLKTIQQPARARWFSVDHNQLIWYEFLSKSLRKGKDMLTEMRLQIDDSILLSLKESKTTPHIV